MNDPRHDTSDTDWIDAILADDALGQPSIVDDGFSRRVMQALPLALPSTQPTRHRWIVVAMAIVGIIVGLGFLSGAEELSMQIATLAQWRGLSVTNLLLAAIPLGVLYWLALGAAWQEA